MTGALLYLRDRRIGWSLLAIATLGALAWAGTRWLTTREHLNHDALLLLVAMASLMIAVASLATAEEPTHEVVRSTPFPRRLVLIAQFLLLLGCGALALLPLATFPDVGFSFPTAMRNLVGFIGMGLILAPFVGARWAWVLPTVYGIGVLSFGGSLGSQNRILWAVQPDSSTWAWWVAGTLLVLGMSLCLLRGPARLDDEGEE